MASGEHPSLSTRAQWHALNEHAKIFGETRMRDLFERDPARFEKYSLDAAGLFFDYSKNRIDDRAVSLLLELARATGVEARRDAMFEGHRINTTEGRAVLHTALRDRSGQPVMVDGHNVAPMIREARERAYQFSERVRSGEWRGHTGDAITDIVNIGIGGSDLGPRMACEALKAFAHPRLRMHFVANIDGAELSDVLNQVDPAKTLFIVASKTFTTIETLTNARSARAWFLASGAPAGEIAKHFVAVSTNAREVAAFGIDTANMFPFWDWVGGRFSMWSSIGLPIMLCIGAANFDALLDGAHGMDRHFRDAPPAANMPMLLALIGIWYRNMHGRGSHAVLPYASHLHRLPAYLQQLEMESNGKSVDLDGQAVATDTCPVIWGEPGTNGQHAFYQLLHQGTDWIPIDFIVPIQAGHPLANHHRLLLANCLAQSSALMNGKSAAQVRAELSMQGLAADEIERLAPHRTFPGNRPSNTLMMDRLEPATLGALIALYEHKVLVQGAIWGVNSFDQWGVELGKTVANDVEHAIGQAESPHAFDASTTGLLRRLRQRTTTSQ